MVNRFLLSLLAVLSFVLPVRAADNALLPVWHEGEAYAQSSAPPFTVRRVGEKPSASGGSALFGTTLDRTGDILRYDLELPSPIPQARLIFRYGRQHYKPGMQPAKITALITTSDSKTITREIALDATGGWGNNSIEWSIATFDALGDLPAGKISLQLTAMADDCGITLDGFFLAPKSLTLDPQELTSLLQLQISSQGYAGLRLASHLLDQKATKSLTILARCFSGDPAEVKLSLGREQAGGEAPLSLVPAANPAHDQKTGALAYSFAVPADLADGDYVLRLTARQPNVTLDIPITLTGNLLATVDSRTAKLEAFVKSLSAMPDEQSSATLPEFEQIIGFLKERSDQIRHCVAAPDEATLRWVAAIKGYPKDPVVWADDAARALAQAEETMARVQKHEAPYAGRTGDFRRVYVLESIHAPMVCRVLIPSDYNRAQKVPMILLLHGAGGDADSMPDGEGGKVVFQQADQRGYLVVSPHWTYLDGGKEYGRPPEALAELIAQVRKEYPKIDPARLYCTGASAGAHGTTQLAAREPDLFAAICCVIGTGQSVDAERIRVPVLIIAGCAEAAVSRAKNAKIIARMIELGLPVEVKMISECGHEYLSRRFFRMTLDFFDQHKKRQ